MLSTQSLFQEHLPIWRGDNPLLSQMWWIKHRAVVRLLEKMDLSHEARLVRLAYACRVTQAYKS